MEGKYLYNYRYFNRFSCQQLKEIAKVVGVTYTHPYLDRRRLIKKLAMVYYNQGINYKSEFMEVD
jgi:hypothetical protein